MYSSTHNQVNGMPQLLYPRERDPIPIVQEAGWALGPVQVSPENLAPTRVKTLDHPTHSDCLYQLCYPGC